ncbi:hypothetical protein A4G86_20760 [Burkholderia pseudomallei]|nr:hypothetical protein A4G86_20760 [Burkholderia pseudomallei]
MAGDGVCSGLIGKGNPKSLPSLGLREAVDDRLVRQKPDIGEKRALRRLRSTSWPQPFPVAPKFGDELADLPSHKAKTRLSVEPVEEDFSVGVSPDAVDFHLPTPIRGQ